MRIALPQWWPKRHTAPVQAAAVQTAPHHAGLPPRNAGMPLRYAGPLRRAAAFATDAIVVWIVTVPALALLYGRQYGELARAGETGIAAFAIQTVLPPLATILFWHFAGATPGKMLFDLRVVDAATGARVPLLRCALRAAAYFLSALPLGLGFLWIAIDRRRQGWHDKIAGTVVVRDD